MLLVRNAIWNLAGQLLPLIAAIGVFPVLLKLMGAEGFGLVAIVWTLIGYFSLFDFGLGRALTKFVSAELGKSDTAALPDIVITGMALLAIVGALMAGLVGISVPWLVDNVIKPQVGDPAAITLAFRIVALAIPFVVINVGLRAVIEGCMRFDLTNKVRIPFGLYTIISPAVVAYLGYGLTEIVEGIAGGILLAMLGYIVLLIKSTPQNTLSSGRLRWIIARRLLGFGGWISVSNFVAPIIFHLDRFVISALLSVAVMSYYVVPYEAITKTLALSSAIGGSLFPLFARIPGANDRSHMSTMLTGTRVIVALMVPVLSIIVCFRFELLDLWVGREVAAHGSGPLLLLSVGVFFNALAQMPYSLMQANGRPDLTAKVNLLELPPYAALLWLCVSGWGLEGAATAWIARAVIEMLLFFFLVRKIGRIDRLNRELIIYVVSGVLVLVLGVLLGTMDLIPRIFWLSCFYCLFFYLVWVFLLAPEEKLWFVKRYRAAIG